MKKGAVFIIIFLSLLPFLFLLTKTDTLGGFGAGFANISGLMGAVLILWQMVLGNRFLIRKLTPDYISSIKLHAFLGTFGFFFIMTHPILELLAYGEKISFLFLADFSTDFGVYVGLGRSALYLYLLIWLSSAVIRNKIPYRFWRYLHYLGYPVLFLVFIHALNIGTFLNVYPLLRYYWILLTIVYAVFVVYRLLQLFNYGKEAYSVISKKINASGITYYALRPKGKIILPKIGQFCFIKIGKNSESHPFTVMKSEDKSGNLILGIKTVGKFTNKLLKINIGQTMYIDGPYGIFTKEGHNNSPKIIIAGGIGATPFVRLVKDFGNSNTFMFYANRYLSDAIYREDFKKVLGSNYIDLVSREEVNGENMIKGRLTSEVIRKYIPDIVLHKANIFVCGSGEFMSNALKVLKNLGINRGRIYIEEFSL
ncbi:MAG: ferredoxin reductase family protein [bacterium]|nr:ferredoxin reductase family protein [bacterium]